MVTPPVDPGVVTISETKAGPPSGLPGEEPAALVAGLGGLETAGRWARGEELAALATGVGVLETGGRWLAGEKPAVSAGGVAALEAAGLSLSSSRNP
jgi:hypothetical protein